MNRTLFDGTAIQTINNIINHGGAEYAKYVFREAIKRGYEFDIVFNKNSTCDSEAIKMLGKYSNIRILYISSYDELYKLIDANGYSLFYSALPYHYNNYNCKARFVGVIHGLRSIEFELDEYQHKFIKPSLRRAYYYLLYNLKFTHKHRRNKQIQKMHQLLNVKNAEFITVSNHSKYSLLNFFPNLDPNNIRVYYSPFCVEEYEENKTNKDYYLLVSANRVVKNAIRTIKSFDRLFSNGRLIDKHVVVVGCNGIEFSKYVENVDRFKFLPYVSTDELNALFKGAFCFVYPSLNEGFGYPPLQEMSYGIPVIASSSTSIPEVCQDSAIMFSPTSLDDLCNRIIQIDMDESLRAECIKKGLIRVKELQEKQKKSLDEMLEYVFKN